MAQFKCYLLGYDGRIFHSQDVDAETLDHAVLRCNEFMSARKQHCSGFEVWQRDKRLHAHDGRQQL